MQELEVVFKKKMITLIAIEDGLSKKRRMTVVYGG